jgi:hypothetical protein
MCDFAEMLLVSDLKTVVEARAAELKMPMHVVLGRIRASEDEWAKEADSTMLLNAARAVGIEVTPSPTQEIPISPECKAQLGAAEAPPVPRVSKVPCLQFLRPSWPSRQITPGPSCTPSPPSKSD